ncbi:fibronectin type III and SPRY domain-containing protein 2 [Carettochelys insculpta]|uniref:fibronectin type III and SPRY domain-containing protein 2 n=1 Tax=Carettochelys insculpta TaxID=44489 RepID=UPI003EBE6816
MESEFIFSSDTAASALDTDPSTSMMVPESYANEPEGLTFYHMDLYDSKDRLEIFPDEPAGRSNGASGETSKEFTEPGNDFCRSDPNAYDLEKEIDELAKLYGLDDDKEIEQELLGGNIATAGILKSKETPAYDESLAAVSYGSIFNVPKSSSPVNGFQRKNEMQSIEEQALSGNGCQEEQALPGSSSQEEQIFPGNGFQEEQALPGNCSQEKQALPGSHSQEEQTFPGNGSQEEQALPGSSSQEEQIFPGNGFQEEQALPGNCSQEEQALPGSSSQEEQALPGNGSQEEQVLPGSSSQEEQTFPGNACQEEEELPGDSSQEEQALPGNGFQEEQALPGKDSQHESQHLHNGGADELHNQAYSEEELCSYGKQDEQSIQPISEEEAADIYCATCKIPIRAFGKLFGYHKDHDVTQLANAVESAKEEIHKNTCKLEEQITQMENFASHLEEIFITVEENFGRQEQNFEMHYNEVMQTLAQRYEEKVDALGEEKKQKLEALYGQLVSCGENLDTCKELMETIQEVCKEQEKADFIKAAVPVVDRLGEFLKKDMDLELSTLPDFEDRVIDFADIQQLLDSINTIPAPSAPVINPQTPNSATGTSVRVCWGLFSDDTVEFYQLYYKQVSDDTPSEEQAELMLKVKETYCTVTHLVPNTQYEFWVSASNAAGVSPVSERAVYVTAPSPPVIKRKESRSCENAALVCWESGNRNPVDSYTVELSKLTNGKNGDIITESIVGIPNCEALIQLQPGQHYLISVRAVNMGGPSERSEPVSIHTTGTYFCLNEDTAHPLLSILEDGLTIACSEIENLECDLPFRDNGFTRCIAVLGSMIPFQGKHYWEVEVNENMEYRVGVAFETTHRHGFLGANSSSWCMRHIVTPARHKYEFLHSGMTPDIRITIPPKRIGILLDYDNWKLSFFNLDLAQHLYTFNDPFQHYVHPCFALEKPGILRIRNGIAMPTSLTSL